MGEEEQGWIRADKLVVMVGEDDELLQELTGWDVGGWDVRRRDWEGSMGACSCQQTMVHFGLALILGDESAAVGCELRIGRRMPEHSSRIPAARPSPSSMSEM